MITTISQLAFFGILFIVYTYGRFRRPKSVRSSTTRFLYYVAACFYGVANLLLLLTLTYVLYSSPHPLNPLLSILTTESAKSSDLIKHFFGSIFAGTHPDTPKSLSLSITQASMLATLFLTTFLPNVPFLSRTEESVLKLCRAVGRIPHELDRLAGFLYAAKLSFPTDAQAILVNRLHEPLFKPVQSTYFSFSPSNLPQYSYTKLVYLMSVIHGFERTAGKYPKVLTLFAEEYSEVKARFTKAITVAPRFFAALGDAIPSASGDSPVDELRRVFLEECVDVNRAVCNFLARAILYAEGTSRKRAKKLTELGFEDAKGNFAMPVPLLQWTVLVSLTATVLLLGIITVRAALVHTANFRFQTMIAVIFTVAVICALAPKHSSHANYARLRDRPWSTYAMSAFFAFIAAAFVSTIFKSFMLQGGFSQAIASIAKSFPWYLLSSCIAMTLAIFADNGIGRNTPEPKSQRFIEGAAFAVVLALTFHFVLKLELLVNPRFSLSHGGEHPTLILMMLVGLFLGILIPHEYRTSLVRST